MAILPVRLYGEKVLRTRASDVTEIQPATEKLISDMRETMHAYRGIGLAANQVGVLLRIVVIDMSEFSNWNGSEPELVLVNPVIVKRSGRQRGYEACLSIPTVLETLSRAQRVSVKAMSDKWEAFTVTAEGLLARVLQHEIDHLDGILFVDRVSALRRQFLKRELERMVRRGGFVEVGEWDGDEERF